MRPWLLTAKNIAVSSTLLRMTHADEGRVETSGEATGARLPALAVRFSSVGGLQVSQFAADLSFAASSCAFSRSSFSARTVNPHQPNSDSMLIDGGVRVIVAP